MMTPKKQLRVVAALIHQEGKVLLAQRLSTGSQANLWELPGGKVELGETDAQALQREITEELSLTVDVEGFIGETVTDYGDKVVRLLAYHCYPLGGDIALLSHQAIRWVTIDEALTFALCPADIPLLEACL